MRKRNTRLFTFSLLLLALLLLWHRQLRQGPRSLPTEAEVAVASQTARLHPNLPLPPGVSTAAARPANGPGPVPKLNPMGGAAHTNGPATDPASEATEEEKEQLRRLAGSLRTAHARIETLEMLSPEQREALASLEQRVGGPVEIRVRPESGTVRFLELPATGKEGEVVAALEPVAAATEFLSMNRALLRLEEPNAELKMRQRQTDEQGREHLRFAQHYQGLEVWPAEVNVHLSQSGAVEMLNGAFVATPRAVSTTPTLSAEQAIVLARQSLNAGETAGVGNPVLIVYGPCEQPARLGWKLDVTVAEDARWTVVIDAMDGASLAQYSLVQSGAVSGSGADLFGVSRSLRVWQQGSSYYLADTSKPMFVSGTDPLSNPQRGLLAIRDARNVKLQDSSTATAGFVNSSSASAWLRDGVSAAFGVSETYDYFLQRHGLNSVDGQGASINVVVRYGSGYYNAFFNGYAFCFGDGLPFIKALDVVAHELAHCVTANSARLLYQDQSGAINEAMSDIFGEMVEDRTRRSHDWLVGNDIGLVLRSMSNPSSVAIISGYPYRFPSKMSEYLGPRRSDLGPDGKR